LLAEHRIAQFADPIAVLIGQTLPANQGTPDQVAIETQPVADNLLGEPGTAVVLRTAQASATDRFLLIDASHRVVGLVVRDARVQPPGYSGYARGAHSANELMAVPLQ
jgi:hypothetical protein